LWPPPRSTPFPYTTLFRSADRAATRVADPDRRAGRRGRGIDRRQRDPRVEAAGDRIAAGRAAGRRGDLGSGQAGRMTAPLPGPAAAVYPQVDPGTGAPLMVKVFHRPFDPQTRAELEQEQATLAGLRHVRSI